MAEIKSRRELKSDISFIQSRPTLSRMPALNAAGQSAVKEAQKLFEKKTIQGEFQKLANRKTSLEKVLLGFAEKASKSLETIIREENRVTAQEVRMNEKYQARLVAEKIQTKSRKLRRGKKGEFLITGQVLHPKTGAPISGIVVEAIDKDISKDDLLDVDVTDAEGRYEISFMKKDFKEAGEDLPEVILRLGMDRKTVLFTNKEVIKAEPGKRITIDVTMPEDQVKLVDRVSLSPKAQTQRQLTLTAQAKIVENIQDIVLNKLGTAFQKSLGNAILSLKSRTEKKSK